LLLLLLLLRRFPLGKTGQSNHEIFKSRSSIALEMNVFHFIGGLPLARFPFGDHYKLFLGHLSSDLCSTCSYHCK
ncbi:hypothetical protein C0J52_28141, partial [Blattella germanica]